MILDSDKLPSDTVLSADVAVVGAGPAGIVTALELADDGFDVVLVESGDRGFSSAAQRLSDAGELDPQRHAPMSLATRRQVGGTSVIWGGRCVPYDPVDFEGRDVVPEGNWPVGYNELAPYFQRACDWFACGRAAFDGAQLRHLPPSLVPGLPDGDVRTSTFERWSLPTDFGREYRDRLLGSRQLRLVTGLTVTQVSCAADQERVEHLEARTLDGRRIRVRASRYVLACGGLESTRLLLASPGPRGVPIGDHSGHLGCWYMGHVEGVVARVHFSTPPSDTIFGYERDIDGVYVRRRMSFTPEAQRRFGLPNIVAWLANPPLSDPDHSSGALSLAYLALASPLGGLFAPDAQRLALTGRGVPGAPYWAARRGPVRQHLGNLARDPRTAATFAAGIGAGRLLPRHRRVPGFFVYSPSNTYDLQFHGEHLPNRHSRVTLSDSRDEAGMPRLKIDIRFSDEDVAGVVRAHQHWDEYLRDHRRGHLEYLTPDPGAAVWENIGGGFHQVGTTRMSARPEEGVLSPDLAVHGFRDLFVVSSSAFVTSSQANSTFMIVVIALRLADRLRADLRTGPRISRSELPGELVTPSGNGARRAIQAATGSRPLRVLMVTPNSPLEPGGVQRHVMEVSRRMVAAGLTVEVLCADRSGPRTSETTEAGVVIRSVQAWPKDRDYYLAPGLWREIGRGEWDLIHIQSYHTFVAPLAMLRALTLGVPYVVTFHGGGHSSWVRGRLRRPHRRVLRPLLARAARLVAVARFEIEQYGGALNIPPEQFVLIPNGGDIAPAISGPSREPEMGLFASVGRLERYKGHHRVIAAVPYVLRQRPDAKLLVVGTGPYEPALRRQIARLGVQERVEITSVPPQDRAGMKELLERVSLVVLLSEFETNSLAALEALAAGCGLLVADRAGLKELAEDGLARAVDPGTRHEVIASAILDELDQPREPKVVPEMSWDECAARLLDLYRAVIRDAAGSGALARK